MAKRIIWRIGQDILTCLDLGIPRYESWFSGKIAYISDNHELHILRDDLVTGTGKNNTWRIRIEAIKMPINTSISRNRVIKFRRERGFLSYEIRVR